MRHTTRSEVQIPVQVRIFLMNLNTIFDKLHGIWDPEAECRIYKGSPIIPNLSPMNLIPRIDTNWYLFKIHSNIALPIYSSAFLKISC
jgi:hypothetical protein